MSVIETTRVGSFVVLSIASVNMSPLAVVMSTTLWLSWVRGFDSLAAGSSAARTMVIGWW